MPSRAGGGIRPRPIELVSVGIPNSRCRIAIHAPDGSLLPEGRVGEIRLTGPCFTPGYLNDPAASRVKLAGGWLHTGDLGLIHRGELYFLDRLDELMVVGGRNVIPSDMELLVEDLPEVGPRAERAVCRGEPRDRRRGARAPRRGGRRLDGDELNLREGRIRERLVEEAGLVIKRVVFVPAAASRRPPAARSAAASFDGATSTANWKGWKPMSATRPIGTIAGPNWRTCSWRCAWIANMSARLASG